MRLDCEYRQPQVEWTDKGDGPRERIPINSSIKNNILDQQQRESSQRKEEPDVEVER